MLAEREVPVVIVGGGPAGLSVAGALKHAGIPPLVLDRSSSTGDSWRSRYDRLHLHTVSAFSGLAHLPVPRSFPRYPSRDQYAGYLEYYAQRMDLAIEHNCRVRSVSEEKTGAARFRLDTTTGPVRASVVVVATGMYGRPITPPLPGLSQFNGAAMHSASYKSGEVYCGKRVLVIGIGNTGAEIAADLVEFGAKSVTVSVRTAPAIVPRDFLGTPVQLFGIVLSRVPPRIADALGSVIARIALGNLSRYGMRAPQWQPFSARRIPVIDVGFIRHLKGGRISIRPDVRCFSQDGAEFTDGSFDHFDAVILATGYTSGLRELIDIPAVVNARELPEAPCASRTACEGLYFMGYFESHRGVLYETALASQRLVPLIADDLARHLNASEPAPK